MGIEWAPLFSPCAGPPALWLPAADPVALAEPDEKLSEDIDERQPTPLTTNVSIVFNAAARSVSTHLLIA
ncbi:hypothetical protein Purlil1_9813 [Purpureocillium lilacinum]|uniref:Uncharacterized protein n=1 Tax=Purpureocillium lilacinum TaxID=33203 RepID=A0ABR0BP95_PURLI|nr:hypothetical protein Purlil1_9813 [Purpureocillium lilacinum]